MRPTFSHFMPLFDTIGSRQRDCQQIVRNYFFFDSHLAPIYQAASEHNRLA